VRLRRLAELVEQQAPGFGVQDSQRIEHEVALRGRQRFCPVGELPVPRVFSGALGRIHLAALS